MRARINLVKAELTPTLLALRNLSALDTFSKRRPTGLIRTNPFL
jgi:hypothetical protein